MNNWLRQMLKIKKIRTQLILSIAFVHLVLMFIFVFDMVRRQRSFLLQQNEAQALSAANRLSVNASTYIMANDLDGLERLVLSHSNFPYLKYCMILSPEKTVLAHTQVQYVGQMPVDSVSSKLTVHDAPQKLFEDNDLLDLAVPIKNGHSVIGIARIGFSKEHINENLEGIMRDGIWYIVIALITGTLIAFAMGWRLSKGLYKLIATADKIRLGDRNMRMEPLDSFELQKLGAAFNDMIDTISANETLLTSVMEALPVGVWILDKNGKVKSVNAAGKELWAGAKYVGPTGYGEYKGWFMDSGKPIEPHEWPAAIAFRENRAVLDREMEIEAFDKSRKIILNSAIPLKDANGQVKGLISLNVDITERKRAELELKKINGTIRERIKELDCLYHISELANSPDKTTAKILEECVAIVPPAYQHQDIACARITFEGKQYHSPGVFEESPWRQAADIKISKTVVGELEVFYTRQMPDEYEGPFLKEERLLINSFTDILGGALERKKAELDIREAELKFRNLVEKSLVGVYILQDNKFVYINPQIATDSGFSEAELYTKSILDLVVPEDRPIITSHIKKREQGYTESVQYEFRSLTKEGETIWLEVFGSVTSYNGRQAMIGTMVNITERKSDIERLKHLNENLQNQARELAISNTNLDYSRKRYRELFNLSPLPAWVADVNTLRFLDVNNAAIQHYGYTREEFLSMTIKDIRPPEAMPDLERALAATLHSDEVAQMIMLHQKKDGKLMNMEVKVAPIRYAGINAKITIAADITERLDYINAIEAQNKRLREISWIQSHVVRAPLSRIMGLIPLLEDLVNADEEQKLLLNYIMVSANELDAVIKTISDKSKIEDFQLLISDVKGHDS